MRTNMEELLTKIRTKANKCKLDTKESRAMKGAYTDCLIMIEEFIENNPPKLPESIQEALNSGDGVYRP